MSKGIVGFAAPAWHALKLRQTLSAADLLAVFRTAIPPLDGTSHKGQHGRVAVVGGNEDYVGAPYFAATASLRAGGDLATVFCTPEAAVPLKSLSPDLMVTSVPKDGLRSHVNLNRLRSLLIGPGYGRAGNTPWLIRCITMARKQNLPIVLDADALWHLCNNQQVLDAFLSDKHNTPQPILTPNKPELGRLKEVGLLHKFPSVAKGAVDVVTVGEVICHVCNNGSLKRVGGQGDILSGVMTLFLSWVHKNAEFEGTTTDEQIASAVVAACAVTRRAANLAFEKKGRSLMTSDILDAIGDAMIELETGKLTGS